MDETPERGEDGVQNRRWLNYVNIYPPSPVLAALALPSILNSFRDSVGAIFQTSCSSGKPITNRFSCIACGGCDCISDASTGSTSYTTCAKSESTTLVTVKCGLLVERFLRCCQGFYSPTVRASPPVTLPSVLVTNLTPPETPESLFLSILTSIVVD